MTNRELERAIYDALANGPMSDVDLARKLSVTPVKITQVCRKMRTAGQVEGEMSMRLGAWIWQRRG